METSEISKELFIKNNLLNSPIRNFKVSALGLTKYKIKLQLNNIYFKDVDEVYVVLKNVKTRDIFIGESSINNNTLHINLKALSFMCTDNEFMLLLIVKRDDIYSVINPVIKDKYNDISDDFVNLDLEDVEWYLRILENGELRLSAIVKNSFTKSFTAL